MRRPLLIPGTGGAMKTRYYKPNLPPQATNAERLVAGRWCRITGRTLCRVWLVVGNQYFQVGCGLDMTIDEANWHCWMLAKALAKVETNSPTSF